MVLESAGDEQIGRRYLIDLSAEDVRRAYWNVHGPTEPAPEPPTQIFEMAPVPQQEEDPGTQMTEMAPAPVERPQETHPMEMVAPPPDDR